MLEDLLSAKRKAILDSWRQRIVATYPEQTAKFLDKEKDRFSNPVGFSITSGAEALFEMALGQELDEEALATTLDGMLRIRSVQDITPSRAVGFVLTLKNVVREELGGEIGGKGILEELFRFEDRVDRMALQAFEVYTKCREDLHSIRLRNMQDGPFRLLERRKRILEDQEQPLDPGTTCGLNECDNQGGCGK